MQSVHVHLPASVVSRLEREDDDRETQDDDVRERRSGRGTDAVYFRILKKRRRRKVTDFESPAYGD